MAEIHMDNPPVFGDLGGPPVRARRPRRQRLRQLFSTTYSLTYLLRPTFVIDSYVGWTRSSSNHDPVRLDENVGLDVLGIPGTNSSNPLAGGWPRFSITSYTDIGTPGGSTALRYNDSQFEYTANASWTLPAHTVRFGIDFSRISLNHYEAENGPGSFLYRRRHQLSGGPSPNQFNSFAQFLLGLPSTVQKEALPFDDNQLTSRQTSISLYLKDQWQASRKLTLSYGVRWDYFPMGTRRSRGMERYDVDTNQMSICGEGGVPTDCGYRIEQKNFSPRLGAAYRPTDTIVLRAGYGINYDPYPLAFVRNMLTNYPNFLQQTITSPNAFQPATRLSDGIPELVVPDISSGRVVVPTTYAVRSLPQVVERGYIHRETLACKTDLGGVHAQAAYVARVR